MAGSGGNTLHWPLTGNLGTHDPTLINENGTWWEFQTGTGIFGKVSRNGGLQWDPLPSVLPNGLSWWRTYVPNQSGNDVWAPDVKVYNGRTYMYYSVSTFGSKVSLIGLISASSIATGDWRDDGLVIRTTQQQRLQRHRSGPGRRCQWRAVAVLRLVEFRHQAHATGQQHETHRLAVFDRQPRRRHRGAEHRAAQWLLLSVRVDGHLLPGREQHVPDSLRAFDQHHGAVPGHAAA